MQQSEVESLVEQQCSCTWFNTVTITLIALWPQEPARRGGNVFTLEALRLQHEFYSTHKGGLLTTRDGKRAAVLRSLSASLAAVYGPAL